MTKLDFDGRVAIVTGAGRGLGRAHALALAARGARVIVNDIGAELDGSGSSVPAAEEVVKEIAAKSGQAIADMSNIADPDGARSLVEKALSEFGRIDILINNAGIIRDRSFRKMTLEDFRAVIDVHLMGAVQLCHAVWEPMKNAGYGRIISTTSMTGYLGNFGQTNYGTAKMGLIGLTRTLALEGESGNIKCNIISPVALTRMTGGVGVGDLLDGFSPELVSAAVVALAHEDCPVNGSIISAGGGRFAEVLIAETDGYFDADATPESVAGNWEVVRSRNTLHYPATIEEGQALFLRKNPELPE
jgi:NAD(P)-dependent dehydrogenase (short-subunit alcohol dehydrogenase family)